MVEFLRVLEAVGFFFMLKENIFWLGGFNLSFQ